MSQIDERLFDLRIVERNIKRGKVTRAQYNAWLESLEDSAEQSTETETVFVSRIPDENDK